MKQPLAIVGASVRSAAAAAVRAGFQPLAADLFADADLRRIATATRISPYPDGFLDWLRAIDPAAWMYTGALENHPELVDQMAWIAPLWGNPGDVLERVRSPLELAVELHMAQLLFPEIRLSPDGLPRDGTWLAKTYQGASGSGVRTLSKEQGARSREQGLPNFFQKRIAGTPCAAVFVAAEGAAALLGVTRQLIGEEWLGAHGFQYAGSIGPWPVSESALDTITRIGNVLAKKFELMGLFGIDFMLDGDDVWTLEVNPRYTASVEIVERITGVQAIAAHAAACRDGESLGSSASESSGASAAGGSPEVRPQPPIGNPAAAHGKAILFARRDVVISTQFAEASLAESLHTPWPMLADVSTAGTPIECGRPVITLFAEAATVDEVEQRLQSRVLELERSLYPDR